MPTVSSASPARLTTWPTRPRSSSAAVEAFGRVDYLVNNAGTNPVFGPMADLDLDVARKVFETNVISALGFAQLTWKAWQSENGGAIVNIASVAGISRRPSSVRTASARPP